MKDVPITPDSNRSTHILQRQVQMAYAPGVYVLQTVNQLHEIAMSLSLGKTTLAHHLSTLGWRIWNMEHVSTEMMT